MLIVSRRLRVNPLRLFGIRDVQHSRVGFTPLHVADVPRGMGFLLSRNRINEAISRGEYRATIIRSQALTVFLPASQLG